MSSHATLSSDEGDDRCMEPRQVFFLFMSNKFLRVEYR